MKHWSVAKFNKEQANSLASQCGVPPFLAMLLSIRGFDTKEKVAAFLSDEPLFSSPFEIKDMQKAADRILKAVDSFEKICVYGDYDADGVTSTALLYSYLEAIDANVMFYIPSREDEGYGMNRAAVDYLKEQGVSLIVTVDNGIAAVDEVSYASSLGIDTVVTDHHAPPEVLPDACAVVDLHQKDCNSKFKLLSGVGVAFKLVMALEGEYADLTSLLDNYADLVCIGTIGDIVSLTDENRAFVKYGLKVLENSERAGVRALLKECGLLDKPLNASNVAFGIVPRINAAGRLGLSQKCVSLLLTDDEQYADEIAVQLGQDNARRKEIEKEILEDINRMIVQNPSLVMDKIIVIDGENWHRGVIGIVAARIKDIYGKPALIIAKDGEESCGSGRSIEGFSLCDAVFVCGDCLTHYGGHPMAVGIGLKTKDIDIFRKRINNSLQNIIMPYDRLLIDCKLNPAMLDASLAHILEHLEPYGAGNSKPLFGLYNMTITDLTPLKDNRYLKLSLARNGARVQVMSFSIAPSDFMFKKGDTVDLAVTLEVNEYQGRESLTIILKDIKEAGYENSESIDSLRIFEGFCRGESLTKQQLMTIYPSREDFACVYRFIRSSGGFSHSPEDLCRCLCRKLSLGKIKVILEAMNELRLIEIYEGINSVQIKYIETSDKVDLQSSGIIKALREVL